MKRGLKAIDGFLIRQFERASRWIQGWTGWDCLDQARASFALAGMFVLWGFTTLGKLPLRAAIPSAILYLVGAGTMLGGFTKADHSVRSQAARGLANHRRADPFVMVVRFFFLLLFLLTFWAVDWRGNGQDLCLLCGFYLTSCDPLPPCRGKVRDWWASLGEVPTSEPAPSA